MKLNLEQLETLHILLGYTINNIEQAVNNRHPNSRNLEHRRKTLIAIEQAVCVEIIHPSMHALAQRPDG